MRLPAPTFTAEPTPDAATDFSLVLGGPLYQLWRGTRLAGDALQLVRRRIIVLLLLIWAPLLLLSIAQGHAWGDSVKLPFLRDIQVQARLLLALPLLVVAELVVHRRMRPVVGQFVERRLIPDAARIEFDAAIASAVRLRNSVAAEVLLLGFVYVVGVGVVWRTQVALDVTSWYGSIVDGRWQPSWAGWWQAVVSLPFFQFLLLRWYFRLFIWARFLWRVSRIELAFETSHPDRCGGLGFLAMTSYAFSPVLMAQGVLLAGTIANRIFYTGAALPQFKLDVLGVAAVAVFAVLGPLLVFGGQLAAAKRVGLREYGILAQTYSRDFKRKWVNGGAPADEPLLGSADIQSLADLGNSYQVVQGMRWVPFTTQTALQLAVTTVVPVLPLTLTMIPLDQLLDRLIQMMV